MRIARALLIVCLFGAAIYGVSSAASSVLALAHGVARQ
jgi:hypothetical protein